MDKVKHKFSFLNSGPVGSARVCLRCFANPASHFLQPRDPYCHGGPLVCLVCLYITVVITKPLYFKVSFDFIV